MHPPHVQGFELGKAGGKALALARRRQRGVVARRAARVEMGCSRSLERLHKRLVHGGSLQYRRGGSEAAEIWRIRLRDRRRGQRRLPFGEQAVSTNPENKVLLLEAGGRDDWFWIDIPVGYLYTIANPRTDWCYKTEPDEHLAGRSIHYARGRVLGGCSSINAMIYMRGQKEDWDHWASLGNRGWSWDEVLPLFLSLEDYEHGAIDGYGAGGEVRIEDPRVRWEIIDAWRAAAAECGIPPVKVFNRGDNFGCAYFQMNQKRGRRWSATNAFLRPVMHRANLTVMTGASVLKLNFEGKTLQRRRLRPPQREVLGRGDEGDHSRRRRDRLAAAAAALRNRDRATTRASTAFRSVHDLPGVGENLQDHLQIRMQYKVKNVKTLNGIANSLWGKAAMALEYFAFRTGPLTMPPSQAGAFARSDPSQPTPNIEWHVQPLSLDKFGDPLHSFPAITPSVCNLRPASRGWVRIKSPDPAAYPEIRLNYLSDEKTARLRSMRCGSRAASCPQRR